MHAFAFEDYDGGLGGAILLTPPLCTMKAVPLPCWLVGTFAFHFPPSCLSSTRGKGGGRTASLLLMRLFLFLKKTLPFFGDLKSDESASFLGGKFEEIFIGTKWEDCQQKRFLFFKNNFSKKLNPRAFLLFWGKWSE